MKKLVLAMCIMASTSALASNEMYALGGVGIDSGDVGGQFTFGSQIMHSNWHVESTLLAISLDDTYSYNNGNDTIEKKEKFDTLMFSVAPMYKHSFSDNFAIFGKAGLFFSHSDTKLTFNYSNQNSEVSKGSH
ncbi:hypothetical protein KIV40_28690, partial [Vibrio sp. D173a]|uniref:hypothetical protein n=1 Tax=Vibrio sp. D173a TaxID=2836349 RepID=UPI002554B381